MNGDGWLRRAGQSLRALTCRSGAWLDTLEKAQALAQELGPVLDVDESDLVNGILGQAHSS